MGDWEALDVDGRGATSWRLADLPFDVETEVTALYARIDARPESVLGARDIARRWLGDQALEVVRPVDVLGLGVAYAFQLPSGAWRLRVARDISSATANAAIYGELAYAWLTERRLLAGLDATWTDRSCDALARGLCLPGPALERLLPRRLWRLAWDLDVPEQLVALRLVEAFDRSAALLAPYVTELRGPAEAWPTCRHELAELAAHPPSNCTRVDLLAEAHGLLLIRHPLIIRLDFDSYASYCLSTSFARPAVPPGGSERGPEMSTAPAAETRRARVMSLANVTDEPDRGPQATILHGPPGVGKTTFVADATDVIFICSERGLKAIGPRRIAHFPYPTNLVHVYEAVDELIQSQHGYRHLVIDSIDWVESLMQAHVCAQNHVPHMEGQDYKKLYVAVMPFVDRLLRMLDVLRDRRQMHIWLVAHSVQIKMSNSQGDTWDKWELKLERRVAERLREWADNVLFADFVTDIVKGGKGRRTIGKMKGRALYTMKSADHFAKNRNHLPERLPLSFKALQTAFNEKRQAPDAAMKARLDELLPRLHGEDQKTIEHEIETYKLDDPRRFTMILTMAETMSASYDEDDDVSGIVNRADLDDEPTDPSATAPANDGAECRAGGGCRSSC